MIEPHPRRAATRTVVALVLATLAIASTTADSRAQQSAAARFSNITPFARSEWGTATVPFAQGEWSPGEHFAPIGFDGTLEPFGARWPDGSVRFARLTTHVTLQPGEDVTVPVQQVTAPVALPYFQPGPWTTSRLDQFRIDVYAEFGGTHHVAPFTLHEIVASNEARQTLLFRARIPNCDLVYDLWVTFFSWQDHATFELRVTCGDTTSPKWRNGIKGLGFVVHGAMPFVAHSTYHRTIESPLEPAGPNGVALIHESTEIYDGQAIEYYGTLLFVDPAIAVPDAYERLYSAFASVYEPLIGVATNWPASGAFGPFGKVPELPPWFARDGVSNAEFARDSFLSVVAEAAPLWENRRPGLLPYAPAPGDQNDFGTTQYGDIFRTALPHRIAELRWAAGEEAFRPVHFREPDGSPMRAVDHPNWIAWSGRTHADFNLSPDRLGKPWPEPWLAQRSHGWTGKDNSHWSSLTLAAAYLVTTSDSLLMDIHTDIELYLASHTTPAMGTLTTNNSGPSRAIGRTMLSMAWHALCTGRTDVVDRLRDRAEQVVGPQWDTNGVNGPVRPCRVMDPDPRTTVVGDFWSPWQEAINVVGLEANYRVTGSLTAKALAYTGALTVLWNAWDIDPNDFRIGYAVAYLSDGAALTTAQYDDPTFCEYAASALFRVWCLPATKVALEFGTTFGDAATTARAVQILQQLQAARPTSGKWDKYADWEAI